MNIFLALFLFLTPLFLAAHGFDPPKEKSKTRLENLKTHASKPTLLTSEAITRFDKIPEDVIVVSCKLMGSGSCRGISILLFDDHGKKILAGNSGISGIVGFEGLEPNEKYSVKVDNEKYFGDLEVSTGQAWIINLNKSTQ